MPSAAPTRPLHAAHVKESDATGKTKQTLADWFGGPLGYGPERPRDGLCAVGVQGAARLPPRRDARIPDLERRVRVCVCAVVVVVVVVIVVVVVVGAWVGGRCQQTAWRGWSSPQSTSQTRGARRKRGTRAHNHQRRLENGLAAPFSLTVHVRPELEVGHCLREAKG